MCLMIHLKLYVSINEARGREAEELKQDEQAGPTMAECAHPKTYYYSSLNIATCDDERMIVGDYISRLTIKSHCKKMKCKYIKWVE